MYAGLIIALVLVSLSAFLIFTHSRKWGQVKSADLDPRRISFGRRQFRRRMFTSFLIGLAGICFLGSPWMLDPTRSSFWWYWLGMLSVVALLMVFALLDFWDSYRYLRLVENTLLAKRAAVVVGQSSKD
ncbi:MAG: hypothetical protein P8N76_02435 [Pirellulaceae bacterium]|nr:hypothetical protein [Pirellulaceae bacterium]